MKDVKQLIKEFTDKDGTHINKLLQSLSEDDKREFIFDMLHYISDRLDKIGEPEDRIAISVISYDLTSRMLLS
jgi:hypothetical protein